MRHISTYIIESIEEYDDIIDKLSKNTELGKYTEYLNMMIDDPDSEKILRKAFVDNTDRDSIKLEGKIVYIPTRDLKMTQSELDISKCVGYPFKNEESAHKNMDILFPSDNRVKTHFPVITFNGERILDGHHRWAKVFSFNPDSDIECFDIRTSKKISPKDMLKILQGIMAARCAEDTPKRKLPKSVMQESDIFRMGSRNIRNAVKAYVNRDHDITDIIIEGMGLDSYDDLTDILYDNIMLLKQLNSRFASHGSDRGTMPQLDKGGTDPTDKKSALPQSKGSVLNQISRNRIDKDTI